MRCAPASIARLRTGERPGKGRPCRCRLRTEKANGSEPLLKRGKRIDVHQNRDPGVAVRAPRRPVAGQPVRVDPAVKPSSQATRPRRTPPGGRPGRRTRSDPAMPTTPPGQGRHRPDRDRPSPDRRRRRPSGCCRDHPLGAVTSPSGPPGAVDGRPAGCLTRVNAAPSSTTGTAVSSSAGAPPGPDTRWNRSRCGRGPTAPFLGVMSRTVGGGVQDDADHVNPRGKQKGVRGDGRKNG